ncbi:MAG TPA: hypothetical protein VLS89_06985 [Candidatus Nanopelagicales bacterium]|nr:hypothetical protein [Candidatus Nanopelagicales bacterium]
MVAAKLVRRGEVFLVRLSPQTLDRVLAILHEMFAFAVNLDGAPPGPVLLVDDVIDSKWSMTVIGALLRQSGAALVYPLALSLASSSAE